MATTIYTLYEQGTTKSGRRYETATHFRKLQDAENHLRTLVTTCYKDVYSKQEKPVKEVFLTRGAGDRLQAEIWFEDGELYVNAIREELLF